MPFAKGLKAIVRPGRGVVRALRGLISALGPQRQLLLVQGSASRRGGGQRPTVAAGQR
jgi:hypothetical protein